MSSVVYSIDIFSVGNTVRHKIPRKQLSDKVTSSRYQTLKDF